MLQHLFRCQKEIDRQTDRNKNRGFWSSGSSKGSSSFKGRGKSKGKFSGRMRNPWLKESLSQSAEGVDNEVIGRLNVR